MTVGRLEVRNEESMPRYWQMTLVALCTLILCSCRAPSTSGPPALPSEAFAGPQGSPMMQGDCPDDYMVETPDGYPLGTPLPHAIVAPWAPPGLSQPWPEDEYLIDGGDRDLPVAVSPDWTIKGLESEDTIAHFDTLDGRTLVEASNPVFIYAPRFGAVRTVVDSVQEERVDQPGGVAQPIRPVRHDEVQIAAGSKQQVQPVRQNSTAPPVIYRTKVGEGAISGAYRPDIFQDAFLPYENLTLIREGTLKQSESALLAKGVAAAITWASIEEVQIILDHQSAAVETTDHLAHEVYAVKDQTPCPRLRIVKVASTQFAEPGDTIDFTLRFDNVGNQPIGNVTIVDNLTTRLEYVPESAQSSLKAEFRATANPGGSDILRWEITDPLPAGEGGIVRFRCRVR